MRRSILRKFARMQRHDFSGLNLDGDISAHLQGVILDAHHDLGQGHLLGLLLAVVSQRGRVINAFNGPIHAKTAIQNPVPVEDHSKRNLSLLQPILGAFFDPERDDDDGNAFGGESSGIPLYFRHVPPSRRSREMPQKNKMNEVRFRR